MKERHAANAVTIGAVFASILVLYGLTFSFRAITDTNMNSLQTRALVLHGDVDLSRYGELPAIPGQFAKRGGQILSVYGVGISIVAAPIYFVLVHLGASEHLLQGAVGALYAAAAAVVFHTVVRRIAPPALAAAATIVFAFGTTMWTVASMGLFLQGPVVFFECLALAGLFSRKPSGVTLAGFAMGMATFIRPTAVIPLAIIGIFYLTQGRRSVTSYALAALVPVLAVVAQNQLLWGSWLTGGYSYQPYGFHASMPHALWGLTFGLWRGLFVYSPILLLALIGVMLAWRDRRGTFESRLIFLAVSSAATILFYSKWTIWWGGLNQFGYRLLLETMPFLMILVVYAVVRVDRLRPLALLLGSLSVLTMTWGAASSRGGWDGELFATKFRDTSLGQSWIVFFDKPLQGIARLAGVAIVGVVIAFARPRFRPRKDLPPSTAEAAT